MRILVATAIAFACAAGRLAAQEPTQTPPRVVEAPPPPLSVHPRERVSISTTDDAC